MLQNCVLLDTTRYRCSQCQDNYVIDAVTGRCGVRLDAKAALISPIIDKDVNCLLSNPDNTCKQCANNYARFNGKCFKEDVMCKIRSELGGCESCYERSYLGKDGICMLIRSNCDIYDPKTGECIDCVPGWTKNALNECQRN